MVQLTRIYTRGGDKGKTSLATGQRVVKHDPRVTAYGTVDEANAAIGVARLHVPAEVDALLSRIQNDLFDVGADLATPEGCASVERAVVEKGLAGDYLVNNAGFGMCGDFAQSDRGRLAALTDLNVRALTDLSRRFLPGMIARRRGGLLNVASLAGFMPGPYQAAYYASKAYVLSLTEALAEETRGTGVRVAVLAPGPVKTDFHTRMGGESAAYIRFQGLMRAETVARIGYANFMCGQRVIVPGMINVASAAALRVAPHTILTPFAARLLKPEDDRPDA